MTDAHRPDAPRGDDRWTDPEGTAQWDTWSWPDSTRHEAGGDWWGGHWEAGPQAASRDGHATVHAATEPVGYWWPEHQATTVPPSRSQQRGPGWTAVIVIAAVAALLAGAIGGVIGGVVGGQSEELLNGGTSLGEATPTQGPGATERPEGTVANIAATALPSVVTIMVRGSNGGATGSGFVLDNAGHVITNNHVVADAASSGGRIVVQLSNGRQLDATLVGRDSSYDVAVLDVGADDLTPLPIGSSEDVVVGDEVIAVGAPLGLDSTVTSGIVSALNRPVGAGDGSDRSFINAIQTDAAINPGNSGGPLLDMQGRVVGINSAIAQPPGASLGGAGGSIGLGFAIPSDQVRKTADQLIRTGKAVHPVIGVILDLKYEGEGVRILNQDESDDPVVSPGGPADSAGLRAGDVIVAFEGRPVTDPDELVVAIRARDVGDTVSLTVRRGDAEIDVKMTLQGSTD
jgi:putative serine protease PepD